LFYPIDAITSVEVKRNKESFDVSKIVLKLNKKEIVLSNTIKNNLYSSAVKAGLEPNIIVEFANIFGFEVDFQRDIRRGDTFEVYYEQFVDEDNIVRRTGKIIYASMFVNNKEITLYNFKYNNEAGFYDVDGKSVIKTLMKTPINGARLSSSFGMRKHPILGFNKLHQGTDFAAPKGTPIMASGNGVVTMAQKYKGYGNYILLKHNSTFKTAYAHLSKYGRGIRKGVRVSQGQIIGYVGSTGMSTGPHLHYEVIKNGKKINSQRLKLPTGKILNNEARNKFEVERIKIDVKLAKLRKN
jgi:murein DD-endopeptidase MepM/ murein hydrolase activator NlpD